MTASEEALRRAADLFHEVGQAFAAEKLLVGLTASIQIAPAPSRARARMAEKLRGDLRTSDQILALTAEGFEVCVRALAALGATDVTIHECGSASLSPIGEASEDGVSP